MTVKELIKELSKHDDDMTVVVDGYEGDYEDVEGTRVTHVHLNGNTTQWYYGVHTEASKNDVASTAVVCILAKDNGIRNA